MATELGVGYINILPEAKGFSGALRRSLKGVGTRAGEQVGADVSSGASRGLAGLSRIGARAAAAAGVAISAALVGGVTGGVQRLVALEDAEKRLDSMGLTAKESAGLMQSLNDVLEGTPYALDAGASALARLVSAGVDLDAIPGVMQSITDAAAFGQTDLGEVANIFARIGTNGRTSAMELEMLQDRGIPALSLLADAAGVTAEEFRDMVSRGEVDAESFFDLWEEGAKGFGERNIEMAGAAKSAGDTTRGAFANMRTALSRLGASLAGPVFTQAQGFFTGVTGWLDDINAAVKDVDLGEVFADELKVIGGAWDGVRDAVGAVDWDAIFGPIVDLGERVADVLGRNMVPVLAGLAGAVGVLVGGGALALLVTLLSALLSPIVVIPVAVGAMVGGLVAAYQHLDWFRAGVDAAVGAVRDAVGGMIDLGGDIAAAWGEGGLSGVLDTVSAAWGRLETPIRAVVIALGGLAFLVSVPAFFAMVAAGAVVAYQKLSWFRSGVDAVVDVVGGAFSWLWDLVSGIDWGGLLGGAADAISGAFSGVVDFLGSVDWEGIFGAVSDAVSPMLDAVRDSVGAVLSLAAPLGGVLLSAAKAVAPVLGAVWRVLQALAPVALVVAKVIGVALLAAWKVVEIAIRQATAVIRFVAETVLPAISTVIDSVIAPAIAWFADLFTMLVTPAIEMFGAVVSRVFDAVWAAIQVAWSIIEPIFTSIVDFVGNLLSSAFSNFLAVAAPVWAAIQAALSAAWAVIQPVLSTVANVVGTVLVAQFRTLQAVVSAVWSAVSTAVSTAWGVIQPIFSAIASALGTVLGGAFSGFRATVGVVWEGISTVIGAQWAVISGIFNALKDGISGVASWIGDRLGEVGRIFTAFKDTASDIFDTVGDVITAPIRLAMTAIRRLWNSTLGGFSISIPDFPGIPGRGQSFTIPEMHTGGVVPGRRGDEVLRLLEAGELVIPAAMTRQMIRPSAAPAPAPLAGVGPIHVHLEADGRELAEVVVDPLARLARRDGRGRAVTL